MTTKTEDDKDTTDTPERIDAAARRAVARHKIMVAREALRSLHCTTVDLAVRVDEYVDAYGEAKSALDRLLGCVQVP